MTAPASQARFSRASYFGSSGFREVGNEDTMSCCRRLIRYIADPSTVRAYLMGEFGRSPPIDRIRGMRDEYVAQVEIRRVPYLIEEPAETVLAVPAAVAAIKAEAVKEERAHVHRLHIRSAAEVIVSGAVHFGLTASDITCTRKTGGVVRARNLIAMVLFARGNSYSSIGRFIKRDHSTVIHAANMFFSRDIHEPVSAEAWAKMAPCVLAAARTLDELIAMRGGL